MREIARAILVITRRNPRSRAAYHTALRPARVFLPTVIKPAVIPVRSLLLVDDDEVSVWPWGLALTDEGCEVVEAASGEAAPPRTPRAHARPARRHRMTATATATEAATEADAMRCAVALSALGLGSTSPNPPVGCILDRHGQPVGEGYHQRKGDRTPKPTPSPPR